MIVYTDGYRQGYNHVIDMEGNGRTMRMDSGALLLAAGTEYTFREPEKEIALLLQTGAVTFSYCGREEAAARQSFLDGEIYCLHAARDTAVTVRATADSELYVLMTKNDRDFPAKLYRPQDVPAVKIGHDVLDNSMRRYVYTIFDYQSAPYSNMVLGTVVSMPGRWSAYLPHVHPQPELYYYKFDKPQGFGLGLVGHDAHELRHDSYVLIDGMLQHPMVTAPGYAMLTVWGIAHLPGNPWDSARNELDEHKWMLEPDARFWEYRERGMEERK